MNKKFILTIGMLFSFIITQAQEATTNGIIPSQGISTNSILRGILGMVSLIVIAFLFSSNKKAINWKTVGIGLSLQLFIAIGVLKVSFIQSAFETVGGVFVRTEKKCNYD